MATTKEVKILINARDNASAKIRRIAGVFASAFAVGKISSGVQQIIDAADDIGKGAKRILVTAEEYQKLSYAARLAGADSKVVENAFKRMAAVVRDAGNGLSEAKLTLSDLGLTFEQLAGLSTYEQFDLITAAVQRSTDKLALVQRVFGRSGQQLLPFIDGFREAGDELERLGGIMSNEAVAAAENFNDQMTSLKTNISAAVANSGLIEWLDDVADRFTTAQSAAGGFKWNFIAATEDIIPGLAEMRKLLHGETANETLKRLQQDALKNINKENFRKSPTGTQAAKDSGMSRKEEIAQAEKIFADSMKYNDELERRYNAQQNYLKALRQQIELGKLRAQGLDREAAIQAEINAAMDAGVENEKALAEIRNLAGEQFDQNEAARKKTKVEPGTEETGPLQAMVLRGLSGLTGGTNKTAEKTQQNTAMTVQSLNDVANLLGGIRADLRRLQPATAEF